MMTINGKYVGLDDKDEAIRLHRQMWNDMAKAEKKRGGNFSINDRCVFKAQWINYHGYNDVVNDCFLCEYSKTMAQKKDDIVSYYMPKCCKYCPLDWAKLVEDTDDYSEDPIHFERCTQRLEDVNTGLYRESWMVAPIEDIANLPKKEEKHVNH